MDMYVDAAGGRNQALAVAHGGRRGTHEPRVDAVHDGGIAGLADRDDPALLDADVAFDDAQDRVDHDDVADQHVQRTRRAVIPGAEPDTVAQGLATAMQAFIARHGVVVFDLDE